MGAICRECEAELEHCHGTVIRHTLRYAECTEGDCAGPELTVHTFVVDCEVIGCECAQPIGSSAGPRSMSASLGSVAG